MTDALWGQLIGTIPALAWVVFATVVYLTLRRPVLRHVLPRLAEIKGLGVEITLVDQLLREATDRPATDDGGADTPGKAAVITPVQRRGVLRRLDNAAAFLSDGRILWVDDHPEYNTSLVRIFEEVGMRVDLARSTDEAIRELRRHSYDLVLSDIGRGDDARAGLSMLDAFRAEGIDLPVVIYTSSFDSRRGVDPMIFGATNRPDDVINYVIDIMERVRLAR